MSRETIDHVDLVVASLERSLPFYQRLLAPLGFEGTSEIVGERGERVIYVRRPGACSIGLRQRLFETGRESADRYAIGLHHVAFAAPSRGVVDEIASIAGELGAEAEGARRASTNTAPATTPSSSTIRTGSSWSSSTRRTAISTSGLRGGRARFAAIATVRGWRPGHLAATRAG
jgi:catechol 2,3-dioxygenase-like lactoylglutathione lyase family enzyme